jgi:hypothetical protein
VLIAVDTLFAVQGAAPCASYLSKQSVSGSARTSAAFLLALCLLISLSLQYFEKQSGHLIIISLCSALLPLHGSVDGIDSSLCLTFMSSDASFDRVVMRYHSRTVGRREVAVECFARSPSRGLTIVFNKAGKAGRGSIVIGVAR